MTQTGTINGSLSGFGSNGNEVVLNTPQIRRIGISSVAVYYHTEDMGM